MKRVVAKLRDEKFVYTAMGLLLTIFIAAKFLEVTILAFTK